MSSTERSKIKKPSKWLITFIVFFVCLFVIGIISFSTHYGIEQKRKRIKDAQLVLKVKTYQEFFEDIKNDSKKIEKYKRIQDNPEILKDLFEIKLDEENKKGEILYTPKLDDMSEFDIKDFFKTQSTHITMDLVKNKKDLTKPDKVENVNNAGDIFRFYEFFVSANHKYIKCPHPQEILPKDRLDYQIVIKKQGTNEVIPYDFCLKQGTEKNISLIYDETYKGSESGLIGVFPKGTFLGEELANEETLKEAINKRINKKESDDSKYITLSNDVFWFFEPKANTRRVESLTLSKASRYENNEIFINQINRFLTNSKYIKKEYNSVIYYDRYEQGATSIKDELVRFFVKKASGVKKCELDLFSFKTSDTNLGNAINEKNLMFNELLTDSGYKIYRFDSWVFDGGKGSFDYKNSTMVKNISDDISVVPYFHKIVFDLYFYKSKEDYQKKRDYPSKIIQMKYDEPKKPDSTKIEVKERYKLNYWIDAESNKDEDFFKDISNLRLTKDYYLYPKLYGEAIFNFEVLGLPIGKTEGLKIKDSTSNTLSGFHSESIVLPGDIYNNTNTSFKEEYKLNGWILAETNKEYGLNSSYHIKHDSEEPKVFTFKAVLKRRPVRFEVVCQDSEMNYSDNSYKFPNYQAITLSKIEEKKKSLNKEDIDNLYTSIHNSIEKENSIISGFEIDKEKTLNNGSLEIDIPSEEIPKAKIYFKRKIVNFEFSYHERSNVNGKIEMSPKTENVLITFGIKPDLPKLTHNFLSYDFDGWSSDYVKFQHKDGNLTGYLVGRPADPKVMTIPVGDDGKSFFSEKNMIDYFQDKKERKLYAIYKIMDTFSVKLYLYNDPINKNNAETNSIKHNHNSKLSNKTLFEILENKDLLYKKEGYENKLKAYKFYYTKELDREFDGNILEDGQEIHIRYIHKTTFKVYDKSGDNKDIDTGEIFSFFINDDFNEIRENRKKLENIKPQSENAGNVISDIIVGDVNSSDSLFNDTYLRSILTKLNIGKEFKSIIKWKYYLYDVVTSYEDEEEVLKISDNIKDKLNQDEINYRIPKSMNKPKDYYYISKFNGKNTKDFQVSLNNYKRTVIKIEVEDVKFKLIFTNISNNPDEGKVIYLEHNEEIGKNRYESIIKPIFDEEATFYDVIDNFNAWKIITDKKEEKTNCGLLFNLDKDFKINENTKFDFNNVINNRDEYSFENGECSIYIECGYKNVDNIKFTFNLYAGRDLDDQKKKEITIQKFDKFYEKGKKYNFKGDFKDLFYTDFKGDRYYFLYGGEGKYYRFTQAYYENGEKLELTELDPLEIKEFIKVDLSTRERSIELSFVYDRPIVVKYQDEIFTNNLPEIKTYYLNDTIRCEDFEKEVYFYNRDLDKIAMKTIHPGTFKLYAREFSNYHLKNVNDDIEEFNIKLNLDKNIPYTNLELFVDEFNAIGKKEIKTKTFRVFYFNNQEKNMTNQTDFTILKDITSPGNNKKLHLKANNAQFNFNGDSKRVNYNLSGDPLIYLFYGNGKIIYYYYGVIENGSEADFKDYTYLGKKEAEKEIGYEIDIKGSMLKDIYGISDISLASNYHQDITTKDDVNVKGYFRDDYYRGVLGVDGELNIFIFLTKRIEITVNLLNDSSNYTFYRGEEITPKSFKITHKDVKFYNNLDDKIETQSLPYDKFTINGDIKTFENYTLLEDIKVELIVKNYKNTTFSIYSDYINPVSKNLEVNRKDIKVYYKDDVLSFTEDIDITLLTNDIKDFAYLKFTPEYTEFTYQGSTLRADFSLLNPKVYYSYLDGKIIYNYYGVSLNEKDENFLDYNFLGKYEEEAKLGSTKDFSNENVQRMPGIKSISLTNYYYYIDKKVKTDVNAMGYIRDDYYKGTLGIDGVLNIYIFLNQRKKVDVIVANNQTTHSFYLGETITIESFNLHPKEYKYYNKTQEKIEPRLIPYDSFKISGTSDVINEYKLENEITVELIINNYNKTNLLIYNEYLDISDKKSYIKKQEVEIYFEKDTLTFTNNTDFTSLINDDTYYLELEDDNEEIIDSSEVKYGVTKYDLEEPVIFYPFKTKELTVKYYGLKPGMKNNEDVITSYKLLGEKVEEVRIGKTIDTKNSYFYLLRTKEEDNYQNKGNKDGRYDNVMGYPTNVFIDSSPTKTSYTVYLFYNDLVKVELTFKSNIPGHNIPSASYEAGHVINCNDSIFEIKTYYYELGDCAIRWGLFANGFPDPSFPIGSLSQITVEPSMDKNVKVIYEHTKKIDDFTYEYESEKGVFTKNTISVYCVEDLTNFSPSLDIGVLLEKDGLTRNDLNKYQIDLENSNLKIDNNPYAKFVLKQGKYQIFYYGIKARKDPTTIKSLDKEDFNCYELLGTYTNSEYHGESIRPYFSEDEKYYDYLLNINEEYAKLFKKTTRKDVKINGTQLPSEGRINFDQPLLLYVFLSERKQVKLTIEQKSTISSSDKYLGSRHPGITFDKDSKEWTFILDKQKDFDISFLTKYITPEKRAQKDWYVKNITHNNEPITKINLLEDKYKFGINFLRDVEIVFKDSDTTVSSPVILNGKLNHIFSYDPQVYDGVCLDHFKGDYEKYADEYLNNRVKHHKFLYFSIDHKAYVNGTEELAPLSEDDHITESGYVYIEKYVIINYDIWLIKKDSDTSNGNRNYKNSQTGGNINLCHPVLEHIEADSLNINLPEDIKDKLKISYRKYLQIKITPGHSPKISLEDYIIKNLSEIEVNGLKYRLNNDFLYKDFDNLGISSELIPDNSYDFEPTTYSTSSTINELNRITLRYTFGSIVYISFNNTYKGSYDKLETPSIKEKYWSVAISGEIANHDFKIKDLMPNGNLPYYTMGIIKYIRDRVTLYGDKDKTDIRFTKDKSGVIAKDYPGQFKLSDDKSYILEFTDK